MKELPSTTKDMIDLLVKQAKVSDIDLELIKPNTFLTEDVRDVWDAEGDLYYDEGKKVLLRHTGSHYLLVDVGKYLNDQFPEIIVPDEEVKSYSVDSEVEDLKAKVAELQSKVDGFREWGVKWSEWIEKRDEVLQKNVGVLVSQLKRDVDAKLDRILGKKN